MDCRTNSTNCFVIGLVGLAISLTTTGVQAQYVPKSVSLSVQGGSLVLPPATTAEGDMLRGAGSYFRGLGAAYAGQGAYLQGMGSYEIQHQQAYRMSLQNRKLQLELNREWRQRCEADRQALSTRRSVHNIQTDQRHFRDQPDHHRVASGASLNYLLKQFGPNLATVDFAKVNLSVDELKSIRLRSDDGITLEGLTWSFDEHGRIRWPQELRLVELEPQRQAVEAALRELYLTEVRGMPSATQVKRVGAEIEDLRLLAGRILRVHKHDEIGADASRTFLRQLATQIIKLRSSDNYERMQRVLQPNPKSAAELMRHVAIHNLQFGPCDEPTATAYRALHNQLAEIHRDLHRSTPSLHAAK